MKKIILGLLERRGIYITKDKMLVSLEDIQDDEFWKIIAPCKPYTMTSVQRMYGLYQSVNYILDNNIPGDFVECGVWRGGSSMIIAKLLVKKKVKNRRIYLYDTFEGMSEPTQNDFDLDGKMATDLLNENIEDKENSVWCLASLPDVQKNLRSTGIADNQLVFIKGKVEDTIPSTCPEKISFLRLDTDWYESTKHELIYLYPILEKNGVLIIDDYGHWGGCRKAVDEYFTQQPNKILLNRLDYTGRSGVKI